MVSRLVQCTGGQRGYMAGQGFTGSRVMQVYCQHSDDISRPALEDAFSQFDWKPLLGNRDRGTEGIPRARPLTHGRGTSSVPRNVAASGGCLLDIDWGSQAWVRCILQLSATRSSLT